jgi:lactate dehydrogenase-like 2-hydroxyacid dehydrogenase
VTGYVIISMNACAACHPVLQVLITPHTAFLTHEALSNIASTTIKNIEEFLQDKQLTNQLKPKPQK